jgi:hypothetical protein
MACVTIDTSYATLNTLFALQILFRLAKGGQMLMADKC